MSPEEKKRWENGEIIYEYSGKTNRKPPEFLVSRMTKEERTMWDSGDEEQRKQVRAQMYSDGRVRIKDEKRTIEVPRGGEHDPYELVSGKSRENTTRIERVYADYATQMKELARIARKEARSQVEEKRDPEMAKIYSNEVNSLKAKLAIARKNAPLERQAQLLANYNIEIIGRDHPELKNDPEHWKREKFRQLDYARRLVGAKKLVIGSDKNQLTDREWEAIQKHAVSKTVLRSILDNSDPSRIRQLAMPKTNTGLPAAKVTRAKAMLARGYSRADVCDMLNISESKLINAIGQADL